MLSYTGNWFVFHLIEGCNDVLFLSLIVESSFCSAHLFGDDQSSREGIQTRFHSKAEEPNMVTTNILPRVLWQALAQIDNSLHPVIVWKKAAKYFPGSKNWDRLSHFAWRHNLLLRFLNFHDFFDLVIFLFRFLRRPLLLFLFRTNLHLQFIFLSKFQQWCRRVRIVLFLVSLGRYI